MSDGLRQQFIYNLGELALEKVARITRRNRGGYSGSVRYNNNINSGNNRRGRYNYRSTTSARPKPVAQKPTPRKPVQPMTQQERYAPLYAVRDRIFKEAPFMNKPELYFGAPPPDANGAYYPDSHSIVLPDDANTDLLRQGTTAHEYGHSSTIPYVSNWQQHPLGSIEYPSVAQQEYYIWNQSAPNPPRPVEANYYLPRSYEAAIRSRHKELYPWDTQANSWYDKGIHAAYDGVTPVAPTPEGYDKTDKYIDIMSRSTPERYGQLLRGENFAFNRADSEMRDPILADKQIRGRKALQDRLKRLQSLPGTTAYYDAESGETKYYNMAPEFSKVLTDCQITEDFDPNTDMRNIMPFDQMKGLYQRLQSAETQYKFNNSGFNTDKGADYLNSMA